MNLIAFVVSALATCNVTAAWSEAGTIDVEQQRTYDLLGRTTQVKVKDVGGNWETRDIDRDWSGRVSAVSRKWNATWEERREYGYTTEGWLDTESRWNWWNPAGSSPANVSGAPAADPPRALPAAGGRSTR